MCRSAVARIRIGTRLSFVALMLRYFFLLILCYFDPSLLSPEIPLSYIFIITCFFRVDARAFSAEKTRIARTPTPRVTRYRYGIFLPSHLHSDVDALPMLHLFPSHLHSVVYAMPMWGISSFRGNLTRKSRSPLCAALLTFSCPIIDLNDQVQ